MSGVVSDKMNDKHVEWIDRHSHLAFPHQRLAVTLLYTETAIGSIEAVV